MAYERLFKLRVGTLEINKSELFHLRNRCAATGLRVRGFLRNLIALDHAECVGLDLNPISPLSEDAEISTNTDRRTKATPEVVQIVLHLLDQITPDALSPNEQVCLLRAFAASGTGTKSWCRRPAHATAAVTAAKIPYCSAKWGRRDWAQNNGARASPNRSADARGTHADGNRARSWSLPCVRCSDSKIPRFATSALQGDARLLDQMREKKNRQAVSEWTARARNCGTTACDTEHRSTRQEKDGLPGPAHHAREKNPRLAPGQR